MVKISKLFCRIVSLTKQKCTLDFKERTFRWATLTFDFSSFGISSLAELVCLLGPGKGWTSPLRTITTSAGLKEAVQFAEYATLDFRNFFRGQETKWPPARVRSASEFSLNSSSEMLKNWRNMSLRHAWALSRSLRESESTDHKNRSNWSKNFLLSYGISLECSTSTYQVKSVVNPF